METHLPRRDVGWNGGCSPLPPNLLSPAAGWAGTEQGGDGPANNQPKKTNNNNKNIP